MASALNADLFHYHRNDQRWGFQKSVNFGVSYAWENGADFAFVCNNDIVLHPEAIWRLVERFGKSDVGMVTCMDVRGEMTAKGMDPQSIATISAKDKETIEDAPHPCFSAFMVSKECWDAVGELDEAFAPAYFEDNDYHYRMQMLGLSAIIHPPAMFYHFASRTQMEAGEDRHPMVSGGEFENNRAHFVKKWGAWPGHETFKTPFNDSTRSFRSTQQCPDA
jgi:GT2 family glycosyltransferase